MNKKTTYGLAAAVLFLILLALFVVTYNKNGEKGDMKSPVVPNVAKIQNPKNSKIQKSDTAFFNRSSGVHEINLATKEVKISPEWNIDFLSFAGLPEETDSILNSIALISKDKTQAIVVSATLYGVEESGPDDAVSIKNAEEFICNKTSKSCVKTDILASAYKAAGGTGEWFDDQGIIWQGWDSSKNILYGNLNSEEMGSISPVYVFNAADKSIVKTNNNDLEFPNGAFSPSLTKFIMIENSGVKWELSLYDSGNLSLPIKKIDVSALIDENDEENIISSVAWSKDEKNLVLATDNQIYTLNLDSQAISLRYTDTVDDAADATQEDTDPGIDSSAVSFSVNEKYIVFVDYDQGSLPYEEDKSYTVLKAIDLENNNNVTELIREEDISLDLE